MKPSRVAIVGANHPAYELYCPNFTGMQAGLRALNIDHKLFSCRPVLEVDALIAYQLDLIIYGLLDMVRAIDIRMRIRRELPNTKIVMWYGDLRNDETGQINARMSEIDMMFVSNDAQNAYYESKWRVPQCHFLPLGCQIYDRPYTAKFDFDFLFIGSLITGAGFLDRARMIWRFRDNGLKIWDGNTNVRRAKVMKEMPTMYRSSKITLDISHFTNIQGYTSNRFWIIPASNGFALTKRWPGCEDFYPEGTRVYFDNFEEALEKRDFYLANPEEREKIRAAGYAQARKHTYDKRFVKMFELLYGPENPITNARLSRTTPGLASRAPEQKRPA